MAYTKQLWADSDITKPVSAARMSYIENGILNAHAIAEARQPAGSYIEEGDSRLSDQRTPQNSSVTDAKVASGAAINLDKTADSLTRLAMTDAERSKLAALTPGSTANSTDAELRDRATHTGVQPISSVTNLQTELNGKQPVGDYVVDTDLRLSDSRNPLAHNHDDLYYTKLQSDTALGVKVNGSGITDIVKMTQAEYNAITPSATVLYVVTG